jgi:hypothetical protein
MYNPEPLATLDTQDTGFVCLCPVSCVSNVASVSGLCILDGPLFCLSLSKTQDKDKQNKGPSRMYNPEALATLDTQDTGQRQIKQGAIKNGQSRDTVNIRYSLSCVLCI